MLPVSFIVTGTPPSQQSRGKKIGAWKAKVASAAERAWTSGVPTAADVSFSLTTFFTVSAPDVDNVIKATQDALKGIVYFDDAQVTDTLSRERPLAGMIVVEHMSTELQAALSAGGDFVHIEVTAATDPHFWMR